MSLFASLKFHNNKNNPKVEEVDKNRQKCREHFEIIDKYLIEYFLEDDKGFVVFIDYENDVDWIDERNHEQLWDKTGQDAFADAICKLNIAHALPCNNLDEGEVFTFKKMIGAGYALALNGIFGGIDDIIEKSSAYLRLRNAERARHYFLQSSGIVALLTVIFWIVAHFGLEVPNQPWIAGVCMGILGAYVSIWMRYGRMELTGLSSCCLHYLEAISRLFVGAIFALVAMFAISCQLILPTIATAYQLYAFAIAGFLAGFSEQFVPSLMERLSQSKNEENHE